VAKPASAVCNITVRRWKRREDVATVPVVTLSRVSPVATFCSVTVGRQDALLRVGDDAFDVDVGF